MSGTASIVKLCTFSAPVPYCDLSDPANPKPGLFMAVFDAQGAYVPPTSTSYPATAAVDGPLFGGIGYVRSYYTDQAGNVVATPTSFKYGECANPSTPDFELGCVVDPANPATAPIPVRVIQSVAADGTRTYAYENLITGAVFVLSGTQEFDVNCDRFDHEVDLGCVRDATGKIVKSGVTRILLTDISTDTVISTKFIDAAGAPYTLAAGEVFGDCSVTPPMIFEMCAFDSATNTSQTLRQQVPVDPATGLPNYGAATYTDMLGNAVVPAATVTLQCGCCPSGTCSTCI